MRYPQSEKVLDFVLGRIADRNFEGTRLERKQSLTLSLKDKFGFTIREGKRIVDTTFKALGSIPVEVVDVHELYKMACEAKGGV